MIDIAAGQLWKWLLIADLITQWVNGWLKKMYK